MKKKLWIRVLSRENEKRENKELGASESWIAENIGESRELREKHYSKNLHRYDTKFIGVSLALEKYMKCMAGWLLTFLVKVIKVILFLQLKEKF